jgi:hypothetical protein
MSMPYLVEYYRDVVVLARKREALLSQIAKDLGPL